MSLPTTQPFFSSPLRIFLTVTLLASVGYTSYRLLSSTPTYTTTTRSSSSNRQKRRDPRSKKQRSHTTTTPQSTKEEAENEENVTGEALKEKGNVHFTQKEYEKAIEYYTRAIEKEENCAYYANRAACWSTLGQFHKVIADCDHAIKLSPDYVKCYLRRGNAYDALENLEEAAMDFLSVCVLDGAQSANTKTNMGKAEKCTIAIANVKTESLFQSKANCAYPVLPPQAYVRQVFLQYRYTYLSELKYPEQPTEADQSLHKAIQLLMNEQHNEAYSLMQTIDNEEATFSSDLHKATAKNVIGTYYMIASDITRAQDALESSLRLTPIVNTYLKLASLKLVIQDSDGSVEMITAAEQLGTNDPDIEFAKATLAADLGDGDVAIKGYERAYELDQTRPIALLMLAGIYPYFGQPEKSVRTVETLMEKFPEDPDVICAGAELASRSGDFDKALAAFDRAFKLKERSQYLVAKGNLLLAAGRAAEACEMYEKCIVFEPGFEQGYEQLYRQLMQIGEIAQSVEVLSREIEALSKWAGAEKIKEMCAVQTLLQCFVTLEQRRPEWKERITALIGSSQEGAQ